ncbi:MAG: plastocyanin/azurin family copper-binding protein [Chromatiales bacterium]
MPPSLTIKRCDTVTWDHQQGTTPHTVTSGDFGAGNAGAQFDSRGGNPAARMPPPTQFSHTFNSAGTFPYHCVVHGGDGGMNGTITVNP